MIIRVVGGVVGRVTRLADHPRGRSIWLAYVDLADGGQSKQIVFGGASNLKVGDLVPVAPPGARVTLLDLATKAISTRKMRVRNYRGERSHGMLCSLDELGWIWGGPNEVAVLQGVLPGDRLDRLRRDERPDVVKDWARAREVSRGLSAASVDGPRDPATGNQPSSLDVVHQHVDVGLLSVAYS